MIPLITAIFILLLGSAFCSSSEAALFSISTNRVKALKKEGVKRAGSLLKVKTNISSSVGTIVILNNLFNIVGTIYAGILAAELLQGNELYLGIFSGTLTFLVILFGEIIPKNFGERHAESYGLTVAPYIQQISWFFTPILFVLNKINFAIFGSRTQTYVSEEEIKSLIEQGIKTQSIERDEQQIINNVFRLNDKNARDIMTPRVNIDAIDGNLSLDEQKEILYESHHSRLPVFFEDYDDIQGFILLREALEELSEGKGSQKASKIMNEIVHLKETTRVDSLLVMFQKRRVHIAIVEDDFGGTSGLVTLEDVLEELVGEIVDETDEVVDMREIQED